MRWILAFLILATMPAYAQVAVGSDDNGFIINLLEEQLSTETRQIRLSGVEGVLSSKASVNKITISDADGVWLQIDKAKIVWNRSALLRGRVEVEELAAERISIPRRPLPEKSKLPVAEATAFTVPDLPVSVELGALLVDEVTFGEALFGLAAKMQVKGALSLIGGDLSAEMALERLDEPGGRFDLLAEFERATSNIRIDLDLEEPRGGIAASLLGIPGAPPLDLDVSGSGPVSDLAVRLVLELEKKSLAEGDLRLQEKPEGLGFSGTLSGAFEDIVSAPYRPFFEGTASLDVEGVSLENGGTKLQRLDLQTGGLSLAADAETTKGGFLKSLSATGQLGRANERLVLPFGQGRVSVANGNIDIRFDGSDWDGAVTLSDLAAGDILARTVSLGLDGLATNLEDETARALSGRLEIEADDLGSENPDIADALGKSLKAEASYAWSANAPFSLDDLKVEGAGIQLQATGQLDHLVWNGDIAADVASLAPFSGISGRDLGGSMSFQAAGKLEPLSGGFDLTLKGGAQDLRLGEVQLDPLLQGDSRLDGRIARDADGIRANGFTIKNDQIEIAADGQYASRNTDFTVEAQLEDLAIVTPQGRGAAQFSARLLGPRDKIDIVAELTMPEGQMVGRRVQGLAVGLKGLVTEEGRALRGELQGKGLLEETALELTGNFQLDEIKRSLTELDMRLGATSLRGDLTESQGMFDGGIKLRSPDLSAPAALFLLEIAGSADLALAFAGQEGVQALGLKGNLSNIDTDGLTLGAARLDLDIADLFGVPLASGKIAASGAAIGPLNIERLNVEARRRPGGMDLDLAAILDRGIRANLSGGLANLQPGFRLDVNALEITDGAKSALLARPAELRLREQRFELTPLRLAFGEGLLEAAGVAGESFDIDVKISDLPLDISDLLLPELGLQGRITGDLRLKGPRSAPDLNMALLGEDISTASLRSSGLPAISTEVSGETDLSLLDLQGSLSAPEFFLLNMKGQLPLSETAGEIDLSADLERLDLSALDTLSGRQGLVGIVTGGVKMFGTLPDPKARFEIKGQGLSARSLAQNAAGPLSLDLSGAYEDDVATLTKAELLGQDGLRFGVTGRIPVAQQRFDLAFSGQLPLSLGNIALAREGIQLAGNLEAGGSVGGTWSRPLLSGRAGSSGATLVYPLRNIRVNNIALQSAFTGDALTIERLGGDLAQGGRADISGRLGLGGGFPSDLRFQLLNARYTDGELIETSLSADLALTGPLAGAGLISGNVDVGKTEIAIPSGFGIREGVLLDVQHRNLPEQAALTLRRAGLPNREDTRTAPRSPLRLNVAISAPNQVFIRGRGMDAEMGGVIRLGGTVSDLQPVGQFNMLRGRIGILGQRITFDEGVILLTGDYDPLIRLVATTITRETSVSLTVEGRVSDPEITLSSAPDLPQDEILALLLFQRNVTELTPFQIAQLASAAATLAGRGGGGLIGGLRQSTGLSNLDITSGSNGEIGLRAGAYLQENIYLDLEAEDDGDARATINIDITDSLRGRATFGNDGNSSLGIFFEKDY